MSENFTGLSPANAQNPFLLPNLSQLVSAGPVSVLQSPATLLAANPRVPATNVVTIGGTAHLADVFTLTLTNPVFLNGSLSYTYTVGESDTLVIITNALVNAINSSLSSAQYQIFATVSGDTFTVNQRGPIGNFTVVTGTVTGSGHEGTLSPASSGVMSGGSGPVYAGSQFTLVLGPNNVQQLRPYQPILLDPTALAVAVKNGANLI
jgi:hypothetical protein